MVSSYGYKKSIYDQILFHILLDHVIIRMSDLGKEKMVFQQGYDADLPERFLSAVTVKSYLRFHFSFIVIRNQFMIKCLGSNLSWIT